MRLPRVDIHIGGWLGIVSVVVVFSIGAGMLTLGEESLQTLGSLVVILSVLGFVFIMVAGQKLPGRRR